MDCDRPLKRSSLVTACGVDGLNERSGIGVVALVELELKVDAGNDLDVEASAAVLMLELTVMLEDVVEGETEADVHDLVNSADGRAGGAFKLRGADGPASASMFASRLDDVGA